MNKIPRMHRQDYSAGQKQHQVYPVAGKRGAMIPATQRPDGTWRKARKIRAGFSSVSGGANRYVPPAFRPGARGKGDQDGGEHSMAAAVKDATESSNTTRSLDRLARSPAGRGGGADDAFLSAVLFLLTAAVPTEATPSSGCKRRPSAALDSAEMSPSSAVPAAPAPAPTNGVGRDQQPQQQLSSPPPQPPSPPPLPSLSYPSASAAGQLSPPTSHPESTTGNNAGVTEWGNYRDCRRRQQPQPEGDSTSNDEGAHGDTGDDGDKREELLRSVAEAAKDTLGCECSCFLLQKGQDDKLTCDHATVGASDGWLPESAAVDEQKGWWSKLRQVTRGWYQEEVSAGGSFGAQDKTVGEEQGGDIFGKEWIGLELSLRSSDVVHPDGQAAIMEILKSRVTATTYSRRKRRDDAGEREAEKTTPLLQSTPGSATSAADTNVAAAGDAPPTHEQREENGMRVGVETAGMTGPKDEANKTVRTAICRDKVTLKDKVVTAYSQGKTVSSGIKTIHDGKSKTQTYHAEERACCNMESAEAEVIAAVLVFSGSALSKRERAELHRKAEDVAGVSSSSHGVGDARFLALVCAIENDHRTAAAAGPRLSAEQVALAQHLFRLAQVQYHSRYERLSHREIREVVASGGPNADDHPELHRLLVEHDQNSTMNDLGSNTTTKYRGPKNPVTSQHIAGSEVRGAVAAASVAGASRRADGGQQGDCLATSGFLSDVEHASGVEGGGSSVEPKGPGKGVVLGTDDDDGGIALSGKICPW